MFYPESVSMARKMKIKRKLVINAQTFYIHFFEPFKGFRVIPNMFYFHFFIYSEISLTSKMFYLYHPVFGGRISVPILKRNSDTFEKELIQSQSRAFNSILKIQIFLHHLDMIEKQKFLISKMEKLFFLRNHFQLI